MRLKDIEKTKKEIKGKRRVLDRDKGIVTNLVSLVDDEDDACNNIKKEDVHAIKFEKNEMMNKECGVNKKLNLDYII